MLAPQTCDTKKTLGLINFPKISPWGLIFGNYPRIQSNTLPKRYDNVIFFSLAFHQQANQIDFVTQVSHRI